MKEELTVKDFFEEVKNQENQALVLGYNAFANCQNREQLDYMYDHIMLVLDTAYSNRYKGVK